MLRLKRVAEFLKTYQMDFSSYPDLKIFLDQVVQEDGVDLNALITELESTYTDRAADDPYAQGDVWRYLEDFVIRDPESMKEFIHSVFFPSGHGTVRF